MTDTPERMTPEAALAVLKAQQSWIGPERPDDDEVDAERWDRIEKAHATLAALAQRVAELTRESEGRRVALLQKAEEARNEWWLTHAAEAECARQKARADGAQNIIGPLPARAESGRE